MDFSFSGIALEYVYTIVALLVVWVTLHTLRNEHSLKKHLIVWFFTGFVFNLFSFSFFYTAYPLIWLPTFWQLPAIAFFHIILSFTAGLFFPFIGYVHFRFRAQKNWLPLYIGLAGTLAEIMRSIAITTLLYTQGSSSVGLHWSSGTFGNALAVTPFVEFVYFGGIYTLCGLFFMFATVLYFKDKKNIFTYFSITTLLLIGVHFFVRVHLPQKEGTIALISLESHTSDATSTLYTKQKDTVISLVATSYPNMKSDMLVLPEDTRFISNLTEKDKRVLTSLGVQTVIDGEPIIHLSRLSNYSYVYSLPTNTLEGRGKWFLFPFNEYPPTLFTKILSLWFNPNEIKTYTHEHRYLIGKPPVSFSAQYGKVGTLLCSEMFSHESILQLKKNDTDVTILQSHLPVFHKSSWLFMQYYLISRVIAAQTRTYLIVSSKDAPPLLVSPYGKILFNGDVSTSVTFLRVDRKGISVH